MAKNWWDERQKPTGSLASLQPTTQPPSVPSFYSSDANNPYATQLAQGLQAYRNRPNRFSTESASLPMPAQPPEASQPAGAWQTLKDIGGGLVETFRGIPGVVASSMEGVENPYAEVDWKDRTIEENRQRQQANLQALRDSGEFDRPMGLGMPFTRGEWAETTQSFPYTAATMGPALVGGAVGSALGGALGGLGGPAAPATVPAGVAAGRAIGGTLGGMLGAYLPAGGAATNQFIRDSLDKYRQDFSAKNDREPSPEEINVHYKNVVEPQTSRMYHGEAAPEAAGTVAELGLMKSAIGDVLESGGSLPVRIAKAGGKIALSAFGIEPATETLTQQIQQPAYAATGLTDEAPRSLTSPEDWLKSAGEVYKQAAATSLFFSALGIPAGAMYGKYQQRREGNARVEDATQATADLRANLEFAREDDITAALTGFDQIETSGTLPKAAAKRLDAARQQLIEELSLRAAPDALNEPLDTRRGQAGYLGFTDRANELNDDQVFEAAQRPLPQDAPTELQDARARYGQEAKRRQDLNLAAAHFDQNPEAVDGVAKVLADIGDGKPINKGGHGSVDYNLSSLSDDMLARYRMAGTVLLRDHAEALGNRAEKLNKTLSLLSEETERRASGQRRDPQAVREADIAQRIAKGAKNAKKLLTGLSPDAMERMASGLESRAQLEPGLANTAREIRALASKERARLFNPQGAKQPGIQAALRGWNQNQPNMPAPQGQSLDQQIAADRARLSELAQQQIERQRQETLADRTQAIQQQEADRRERLNAEIATRGAPGELARLLGPETQAPAPRQEAPAPQSLSDLLNRPSQSSAVPTARAGERGSLSDLFPQNRNWWDTELSTSKASNVRGGQTGREAPPTTAAPTQPETSNEARKAEAAPLLNQGTANPYLSPEDRDAAIGRLEEAAITHDNRAVRERAAVIGDAVRMGATEEELRAAIDAGDGDAIEAIADRQYQKTGGLLLGFGQGKVEKPLANPKPPHPVYDYKNWKKLTDRQVQAFAKAAKVKPDKDRLVTLRRIDDKGLPISELQKAWDDAMTAADQPTKKKPADLILWGYKPGTSDVPIKLEPFSKAAQARREKDGWKTAAYAKGDEPTGLREQAKKEAEKSPAPPTSNRQRQQVVTASGRKIDTEFEVVELDDLITSDKAEFPKALQPRDRSRLSSANQVMTIAGKLDPQQLADSRLASDGAPVIGPDNVVESGNGRTMALREVYGRERLKDRADAYRAMIEANGFDVAGMNQPVLVRRRITTLTDQERKAFTEEANARNTLGMSPAERAMVHAGRMDATLLDLYKGGDLTTLANSDFVRGFMSEVAPDESAEIRTADGLLNQEGIRRIEAAILAKAYPDSALLGTLLESTDNNIKAIGGALLDSAPAMAGMKGKIAQGLILPETDISADVVEAARLVAKARREGKLLSELLAQSGMFGDNVSPLAQRIVRLFFADTDFKRQISRDKIAGLLNTYAELAKNIKPGDALFDDLPALTVGDVIGALEKKNREPEKQQQPALFGGNPARQSGTTGGRETQRPDDGAPGATAGAAEQGQSQEDDLGAIFDQELEKAFANAPSTGESVERDRKIDQTENGVGTEDVPTQRAGTGRRTRNASGTDEGGGAPEQGDSGVSNAPSAVPGAKRAGGISAKDGTVRPQRGATGSIDSGRGGQPGGERIRSSRGAASRSGRTSKAADAGVKAGQAAVEVGQGLKATMDGLAALFGGKGKLSSGLTFDEETYQQAVPFFKDAVRHFKEASKDAREAIRLLIQAMMGGGYDKAVIASMKPYAIRFVTDVRNGVIDLTETEPHAEPETMEPARVDYTAKRDAQRAAESVAVKSGDIDNIRATLPYLLPEQQNDVLKAEQRFERNNGILFTNATGTGKTYTGLGVIKRMVKSGKENILIVVPSQTKAQDWVEDGKNLGLDITVLPDTQTAGKGQVITTYANLSENDALDRREWDAIIYDESHKLASNQAGKNTVYQDRHERLTMYSGAALQNRANSLLSEAERATRNRLLNKINAALGRDREEVLTKDELGEWDRINEKIAQIAQDLSAKTKPKVVFLSATPFAYHQNLDYADKLLFDYEQDYTPNFGYNAPSARQEFFIRHFGYRMRTGKLTEPDVNVDVDLMERRFHEWLKKTGAVSGRKLETDQDYSREFVEIENSVGKAIDLGIDIINGYHKDGRNGNQSKFPLLSARLAASLDFLAKSRLLEAIKAESAAKRARQHIALGRKVVIFHDYIEGNNQHPFRFPNIGEDNIPQQPLKREIDRFNQEFPELVNLDLGKLSTVIGAFQREFGDQAKFFNGRETKKNRARAIAEFNRDDDATQILVVQRDAGKEGISLHDVTGKRPRALIDLGLPTAPTEAIQTEGRIYRYGQKSNAVIEYLKSNTKFEEHMFSSRVASRARTAENLALGDTARNMETAFVDAYLNSSNDAPSDKQGTGNTAADARIQNDVPFDTARSLYFGQRKRTSRDKSREGVDYFATPEPLGLKMVEWADASTGDAMLEPSAGHGAIARWFPEDTRNTFVEPSRELSVQLGLSARNGKILDHDFETLHATNKYDAIVMNPPFGSGGATAIAHLGKAAGHLKNGGRIVVLYPEGPAADKRMSAFLEKADNLYTVAEFGLPPVVFERAGTTAKTRILVLEKQLNADDAPNGQGRIDLNADTISEFFDKIRDLSVKPRNKPTKAAKPEPAITPAARGTVNDLLARSDESWLTARGDGVRRLLSKDGIKAAIDHLVPELAQEDSAVAEAFVRMGRSSTGLVPSRETNRLLSLGMAVPNHLRKMNFTGKGFEAFDRYASISGALRDALDAKYLDSTAPVTAPSDRDAVGFILNRTTHAKKSLEAGQPVPWFSVSMDRKISSDAYTALAAQAKKLGGYWSSYRGQGAIPGFQFSSEQAATDFIAAASTGNAYSMPSGRGGATPAQTRADLSRSLGADVVARLEQSGRLIIHDKPSTGAAAGAQGWVDQKGVIHLVPANLESSALSVVLHESAHLMRDDRFSPENRALGRAAHAVLRMSGLQGLIGNPSYNDLIQNVYRLAAEGNKTAQAALAKATVEPGNTAEEALSYIVEYADEKLPIYRRIMSAIRAALYRLGIKVNLTPADLRALALSALKSRAKEITARNAQPAFSLPDFAPTEADRVEVERQMKAVKEARDDQGRLLAPNGKPSKLNDRQWKQVRTQFFKDWLGGYEKFIEDPRPSKTAKFKTGTPFSTIVLHGTRGDLSEFKSDFLGSATKSNSAKEGFFFTSQPKVANFYSTIGVNRSAMNEYPDGTFDEYGNVNNQSKRILAQNNYYKALKNNKEYTQKSASLSTIKGKSLDNARKELKSIEEDLIKNDANISALYNDYLKEYEEYQEIASIPFSGRIIYQVFIKGLNPFVVDWGGMSTTNNGFTDTLKTAKNNGHDSVVFLNARDPDLIDNIFVVFDPNQIKSAIGNAGTFSPRSNRIDYSQVADEAEQDQLWREFQAVRAQFQERQASQSAFDRWFGQGVEGVNVNKGKPLTLFHGTNNPEFNRWDESLAGKASRHPTAGLGFFMTADARSAARYGSRLLELNAKINKPYFMTDADLTSIEDTQDAARFRRKLQAQGYDAAVIVAPSAAPYVVAFQSNQVKLTSNTNPTDSEDFRYSRPHRWADGLPTEVASMAEKIGAEPKPWIDRLRDMRDSLPTRIRQGTIDRFARLLENDRARFGRDVIDTDTALSAWVAAKMSKSPEGALEGAFLHGRIKWDDGAINVQETKQGLAKALETIASAGEINRFWQWIIAKRSSRLMQEGRERLFTPQEIASGLTLNAGTMANGNDRNAVYRRAFSRYVEIQKSVLDVAEQSGLFNDDQRAQWEHDFYLPYYRVIDDEGELRGPSNGGGKLVRQKAFEKLKGGTEKLGDPLQNILRNWHHLIDASLKNRAASLALDTAETLGAAQRITSAQTDKHSVWIMKNGDKVYYRVDDPLTLDAVSALSSPLLNNMALKPFAFLKKALTIGVTISPAFKAANLLRDSIATMAISTISPNVFKVNPIKGMMLAREGTPTQASLLAGGGTFRFGTLLEGDPAAAARRIAGWKPDTVLDSPEHIRGFYDLLKKGAESWTRFGDLMETANRASLYDQLRKEGKTHLQASLAARDIMDFSQSGSAMATRLLVGVVPFINARLQGMDVLYRKGFQPLSRTATGRASAIERQQALRFAAATFAVAAASVLLYLNYKDDDEFQKREQWDRDNYWWFKIGDTAYRIPKPFEVGALGTMAERIVEQIVDKTASGKLFADRLKFMLTQTFSMDPTPQLIKPVLDVYANKDSFTKRPIEKMGMENLSPELRSRYNTSAMAIAASKAGLGKVGLSPLQIEHLTMGYFGWLGAQALLIGDYGARPVMGLPNRPIKQSDIPVIGDLLQRFKPDGRGSRYITEFYEQAKQIRQIAADARLYLQLRDYDSLNKLIAKQGNELQQSFAVEAVARKFGEFGRLEREIASDKSMSGDEKRRLIDELNKNKSNVAKQVMEKLR